MKLSEIMSEKSIFLGLKSNSKRQLLQDMASKAAEITGINERTIGDAVLERENLGSTGFGEGTALPHGRFEGLDKVYGFFAKLSSPVDFEAIDGKPVDLVFMLLSPEDNGADHLTALAQASRLLKDENIRSKLRQMNSSQEIKALIYNS